MMKAKKWIAGLSGVLILWSVQSCDRNDRRASAIPDAPVNLVINLDLPAYFELSLPGAFMYFNGGYNGVMVYHSFDGEYYAYERTCSYNPLETCSILWMDSSTNLYMYCGTYDGGAYQKCCDSRFELPAGFPSQGPATLPMKTFMVSRQGNTLYVNN